VKLKGESNDFGNDPAQVKIAFPDSSGASNIKVRVTVKISLLECWLAGNMVRA
jgi:hypothetical protein